MTPLRASIVPLAALAAALVACGSPTDSATVINDRGVRTDPNLLLTPADKGVFAQNDVSTGCAAHPTRGYGFRTRFDWADVPGAASYKVVFQHEGSTFPAVVQTVTKSELEETRCNSFVADANLEHWTWRVLAIGPATGPATGDSASMPRDTLLASTTREYAFAPCRLADGRACYAPSGDTTAAP